MKETHSVWLHLKPTGVRKRYNDDFATAGGFAIDRMTKGGPNTVSSPNTVMVKVNITLDTSIFDRRTLTANLEVEGGQLITPVSVELADNLIDPDLIEEMSGDES
jgi:hypothetical protein